MPSLEALEEIGLIKDIIWREKKCSVLQRSTLGSKEFRDLSAFGESLSDVYIKRR
jgi:hypothetical protein